MSANRKRVFSAYPQNVSRIPSLRHGRSEDTREKIARPKVSTPRRAQDWR